MCWYRASGLLYPLYRSDCGCFPLCRRFWMWSWRFCWLTYIAAEWFSWIYYCSCCIEGTVWFGRLCGSRADVKYRNRSAVTRLRSLLLVGSGRNYSVPFSMVFCCLDWVLVYFYSPLSGLLLYNVGDIAQTRCWSRLIMTDDVSRCSRPQADVYHWVYRIEPEYY